MRFSKKNRERSRPSETAQDASGRIRARLERYQKAMDVLGRFRTVIYFKWNLFLTVLDGKLTMKDAFGRVLDSLGQLLDGL